MPRGQMAAELPLPLRVAACLTGTLRPLPGRPRAAARRTSPHWGQTGGGRSPSAQPRTRMPLPATRSHSISVTLCPPAAALTPSQRVPRSHHHHNMDGTGTGATPGVQSHGASLSLGRSSARRNSPPTPPPAPLGLCGGLRG
ncbi:hypothetical protein FKM82_029387 [Ascaphus truei]